MNPKTKLHIEIDQQTKARYQVEFDEPLGIVIITLEGIVTFFFRNEALKAGLNKVTETQTKKIIVDLSKAEQVMTTMQQYEYGSKVAASPILQGKRIAFIVSPVKQDNTFIETVAKNRGLIVQSFTSIEQAKKWLTKL